MQFLEQDQTKLQCWIIRQILKTWDRQIAFLDVRLIENKTVLEIGCGNPRMLFYFNELGAKHTIGCDLSDKLIKKALSRPRTFVYDKALNIRKDEIKIVIGDFYDLCETGLKVDTICCFQALHHFSLNKFIEICSMLLAPGGHVIISDPIGDHPLRRIANLVGRWSKLLSPDENAYQINEVRTAFRDNGFRLVMFRSLNPFLEIYFHLVWLLKFIPDSGKHWLRAPMGLFRPIENLIEANLLTHLPFLGWRYYYVFKKSGGA